MPAKIGKRGWIALMAASAVAVVFLNSLSFGLSGERIYDSLVHTFFIATFVSAFVFLVAPTLEKQRFFIRAIAIVIGIVPSTYAGLMMTRLFLWFVNPYNRPYSAIPSTRTFVFSLLISYIFGFGGYLYLTSRGKLREAKAELKSKEIAEQKARTLASEARFASLESRVRPHFLFNTLNSIAALIRDDPPAAERMVERLSSILRYSLDAGVDSFNSLERELAITADYLEIQKSRFTNKLHYEFDIDKNLNERDVPTFAVQTLVENSIKHVAGNRPERTSIRISAFSKNGYMVVTVSDNGEGFTPQDVSEGHGLDNLIERINSAYDGRGSVKIDNSDGGSVSIIIPKDGQKIEN